MVNIANNSLYHCDDVCPHRLSGRRFRYFLSSNV